MKQLNNYIHERIERIKRWGSYDSRHLALRDQGKIDALNHSLFWVKNLDDKELIKKLKDLMEECDGAVTLSTTYNRTMYLKGLKVGYHMVYFEAKKLGVQP